MIVVRGYFWRVFLGSVIVVAVYASFASAVSYSFAHTYGFWAEGDTVLPVCAISREVQAEYHSLLP